ncbi:MAG TPA: AMP-binding protein [Micromonosporaceae bacterium]|nr:AMP-binding protein [Micromonosporaceae bacterium]
MAQFRTADHDRVVGWLDDPTDERGVRFRQDDGSWQRLTYRELALRTLRAGTALAAAGVGPGQVVPLVLPNGPDFVTHFFGLLSIGATPSVLPLPWALRAGEGYENQLRAIAARIQPSHAVVAAPLQDLVRGGLGAHTDNTRLLEPAYADDIVESARAHSELAVLQFTSGSRGSPRGLRITMANMAANLRMIRQWSRMDEHGTVSWLPLYHDMGLVGGMLTPLTIQAENAFMRPEQFLRDTRGWLTEYGRNRYASMAMPNFGFERVVARIRPDHLDGLDFSHLTSVISGAERVDPAVLGGFVRLLQPHGLDVTALAPAYGLAEATLAVTGVASGQVPRLVRTGCLERRLGEKVDVREVVELSAEPVAEPALWQVSCGRPMDGVRVEILDEDGVRQPEGVLGEVLVHGPSVADGYVDAAPEDTAKLSGGTLHTGDAGFLLDGELYVVGRLGDSVKVSGQSLFVEDIEMELVASGAISRRYATVVAGMARGKPTVLVVTERSLGDRAALAVSVIRTLAGDQAQVQVVQVPSGAILRTSSRKPRRRALWLAYVTGELPRAGEPAGTDTGRSATTGRSAAPPQAAEAPRLLFADGPFDERVEDRRKQVAALLREAFEPRAEAAETAGLFPREILADLGRSGLFRERWATPPYGDPGLGVVIAEESGRLGHASLSVGLSLHCETVASILGRYGDTPLLQEHLAGVLDGRLVGCLGASEPDGGSDLNGVRTIARKVPGGWRVTGEKKYLSLGLVCDFALLLCRLDEGDGGIAGRLGLLAVPATGLTVRKRLTKAGTAALDTTWMAVDIEVPDEALVGRRGAGLLVAVWGLNHERLSIAAQTAGGVARAIGLATAHLHRRVQFGKPLMEHQALRLRLAELYSRLLTLRYAVYTAAQGVAVPGACGAREIAALKVTAARFAEEATSECMHLFGGPGYLDETPLSRMWRDSRLGRLGGGSDEMMWELVAGGLVPDFASYDEDIDLG